MDGTRFDELTKRLSAGLSRRQVLRGLAGGAGAITVATVFEDQAGAQGCDPNANTVVCPAGSFHQGLTKKPDGGCCNGNGNCCSNNCVNNICATSVVPECVEEEVECSQVAPCCEGLFCAETPAGLLCVSCVPEGGDCGEGDCCAGFVCQEGICYPEECQEEGEFCYISANCCGDLLCIDDYCGCLLEDEQCGSSSECCGDLLCIDGYCGEPDDCAGLGEICEISAECCGDLICIDYYCGFELPNTGVADGSSGSSSLVTTAIAGGAAALIAAKMLRSKPASDGSAER